MMLEKEDLRLSLTLGCSGNNTTAINGDHDNHHSSSMLLAKLPLAPAAALPNTTWLHSFASSGMARRWFGRGDGVNDTFSTHVRKFTYASLRAATDNFSDGNLIGRGGFAKIYKGVLGDGRVVAVKNYSEYRNHTSEAEFLNNAVVMSHINHRNINQVIGCCIERGHQLLVTNYEENGNVYELLHDQERKESLFQWDVRASVLMGIARGLCYIHEDTTPGIIHRDIKTSNILLDANFTPKITDFDLSVFFHDYSELPLDDRVVGTFGYLDPEYYRSSMISEKVDVYAFGVVMLEIISGRKVITYSQDYGDDDDDRVITLWASKLSESYRVWEIVDPMLLDIPIDVIRRFIDVAHLCTRLEWEPRPSMREVVLLLQGVCGPCTRKLALLKSEDGSHSFEGEVDATHGHLRKFSYTTLCTATDNFSDERLISGNDSAEIYKGILEDGTPVTVKKYYEQEQQQGGGTHFLRIYEAISRLIHQNITKIFGCCVEEDHQLLVTEYAENGSLHDLLRNPVKRESVFNWHMRAALLIGIAQALSHLHKKSVIHRNISSSCIHLDSHFTPKIADFDNADYFRDSNELPRTAPIVGTMGYMDPEYLVSRGEYTEKVDIYAFGVVVLQIISGRNCINWEFDDAEYLISDWALKLVEGDRVMEIVDPLLSDFPSDIARRVIDVALLCTQSDSRLRPSMQEVVVMLRVACNSFMPPRRIDTPEEIESAAESRGITELESTVAANISSDLDESTGCSDMITPIVDNIVRGERAESSRAHEDREEDRVVNGGTEDQVQITTDPKERTQQRREKKMVFGVALSGSDDVVERLSQTTVFKRYSEHVCPEAVYPPFLTSAYPLRARQRR